MSPSVSSHDDLPHLHLQMAQSADEVNRAIDDYALKVWHRENLQDADRIFFAKYIYNLKLSDLPEDAARVAILRVRRALNAYLLHAEAGGLQPQDIQHGKIYTLARAVNEFNDKVGPIPWGVASVTGSFPDSPSFEEATIDYNLAASSINLLKTMKDGAYYFYKRNKVSDLQYQIAQKNEALAEAKSEAARLEIQKELRQLQQKLLAHKKSLGKVRKAKVDAALSITAFPASVVAAASDAAPAVIASAALGGIATGLVLTADSIRKISNDASREKVLDAADRMLADKESPSLPELQRKMIRLKRDNIQNFQKRNLWLRHIKNGCSASSGLLSVAVGILTILVKAGIVIGAAALSATGIGLAVMIGLGLIVGIGIAINHYRRMHGGLMPKIMEAQRELMADQASLYRKMKHPGFDNAQLEKSLQLHRIIERGKKSLETLKKRHVVECQTSQEGQKLIKDIFKAMKNDVKKIDEARQFLQAVAGLDMSAYDTLKSSSSRRRFVEIRLSEWISQ